MEQAVLDVTAVIGERRACAQFGYPRGTYQRRQTMKTMATTGASREGETRAVSCQATTSQQVGQHLVRRGETIRRVSPRALSAEQRQELLDVIHQPRFVDRSVPYMYATLLAENRYYGSMSTMYRVLRSVGEVGERRDQATRPAHVKPELCATGPNQIYAWDITKLHGPQKWTYYYLYAVIDIYSRFIVGWMVADRESSELAKLLLETTIREQGANPTKLTIHSDRGSSMTSKPVAFMLADLGVTKSHSRPHVSNDNPHIEALFKTTKYQPEFPATFAHLVEARSFTRAFVTWYNNEHRHSAIALLTPADVHHGRVAELTEARQATLDVAYAAHPERFVRGRPTPPRVPPASYINRPEASGASDVAA